MRSPWYDAGTPHENTYAMVQKFGIVRFEAEMLGEFAPCPLDDYAKRYHETCEAFDRIVCTKMIQGVAMPATAMEAAMVNRNAKTVFNRLLTEACHALGKSADEVRQSLQQAIFHYPIKTL